MARMKIALGLALVASTCVNGPARSEDTVLAQWREQRFEFPFISHATSYNCVRVAQKIKQVLLIVGAHPKTKVRVGGCSFDRPGNNLYVSIDTAIPVLAPPNQSQGAAPAQVSQEWGPSPFPAVWQTLDLAVDRRSSLRTGDCELVHSLARNVFSQLSVSIESNLDVCSPDVLSPRLPELKVTALVAASR